MNEVGLKVDILLLVVYLLVEEVVVADQRIRSEWDVGLLISRVIVLDTSVDVLPLLVKVSSVCIVLFDGVLLLLFTL